MDELLKEQNRLLKAQLDSINTIKGIMIFFLVVYVISFFVGFFGAL